MKNKLMVITTTLTILSTVSFADSQSNTNSSKLGAMVSAFKNHATITPKLDNDIMMGYAGQDVSIKGPVTLHV